jgi:hypothetical protein
MVAVLFHAVEKYLGAFAIVPSAISTTTLTFQADRDDLPPSDSPTSVKPAIARITSHCKVASQ